MKKIKDERLILKNLKNIKIGFAIQTFGILAILGYDWFTQGPEAMRGNPLWFVLIMTNTVLAFLTMDISVDHERLKKRPKKSLIIAIAIITLMSIAVGLFVPFSSESGQISRFIVGGIFFIAVIIPYIYIYYLRTKKLD